MLLIVVIPPRRRISLVSLDFEVFEAAQFSFEQWPEEWRCIFFKLIKTVVVQTTTRLLKGLGCYLRRVKGPTYSANLGENSQNNKWKWGECWASRLMVTLNGIKKRARNSDIWNCNAPKSPLLTLAIAQHQQKINDKWGVDKKYISCLFAIRFFWQKRNLNFNWLSWRTLRSASSVVSHWSIKHDDRIKVGWWWVVRSTTLGVCAKC